MAKFIIGTQQVKNSIKINGRRKQIPTWGMHDILTYYRNMNQIMIILRRRINQFKAVVISVLLEIPKNLH